MTVGRGPAGGAGAARTGRGRPPRPATSHSCVVSPSRAHGGRPRREPVAYRAALSSAYCSVRPSLLDVGPDVPCLPRPVRGRGRPQGRPGPCALPMCGPTMDTACAGRYAGRMRSHPHSDGLLSVRSVLPYPLHRLGTADNNRTEWTDHSETPTSLVAALLLDDIAEAHGLMLPDDRGTCHACATWAENDEEGFPHHLSWHHEWHARDRK